ncbi:probable RNA-dependent RNA polymerase 1 [Orbicella faveolata]|nr:probable RNA-dependent RNA polymerase 1 [Orbicella faveolata]
MGFPFFVSLPDDVRPPEHQNQDESPLYIKYVEVTDTKPCYASYKKVENSLLLRYLVNSRGTKVLEQLLMVKFKSKDNDFIVETLKKGIECNGSQYHYLGQSNSQLRDKTCFMMNASLSEMHSLLAKFENFDEIRPVARRSQKVALLFSPFQRSLKLKSGEYDVIDDVTSTLGTYVFTDGCGLMSPELAKEVQSLYNLSYEPSVIEVRFKGFSGILVCCNEMPRLRLKALFRNSMSNFASSSEALIDMDTLGIVDYSRTYSLGYLDTQTVMLLAEGGASREYLETLQNNYYEVLDRLEDKTYAGYFLRTTGNEDFLQEFQRDGMTDEVTGKLQRLKTKEIQNMKRGKIIDENQGNDEEGDSEVDTKFQRNLKTMDANADRNSTTKDVYLSQNMTRAFDIRVLTPDARVVYGASDPYDQLNYGECFFQPTLHKAECNAFSFAEFVLVMRRPSYHAGDVRVLRLTHKNEAYKDLHDCIVFPNRGTRPHANECAGGRVGGDKYFVCWDKSLLPRYISSPYIGYISSSSSKIASKVKEVSKSLTCMEKKPATHLEKRKKQQQSHQALMEYFGHFKDYDNLRSRGTELFIKYASLFGSTCTECEQLKEMFLREFDWSERYDQVDKKLGELEQACEKEINGPTKFSHQGQLHSPLRPPGLWNRVLISLQWKKPPFCPGDDVWNKMKATSVTFVESQMNSTVDVKA